MLIESYNARYERREEKQSLILRFLRDEIWSAGYILCSVIGVSPTGVYKTLGQLEAQGLIKSHSILGLNFKLYGITQQGLLYAWDVSEQYEDRSYFEPSRVKPLMVQHYLDTQKARLQAEVLGWCGWTPGHLLPPGIEKRPDAVVNDICGRRIAIELERTVKSKKRYAAIFGVYLQSIKRGEYHSVHYVCGDSDFAVRLKRLFLSINVVPVAGKRVSICEKHHARFPTFSLNEWPENITAMEDQIES
jgi:hypothetical protein